MNQREPLYKTGYLIVFCLLFVLNIVTGRRDLSLSVFHVQSVNLPCLESIGFPHWFDLDLIDSLNKIQFVFFGDLNKLSLIPYYLFLLIIYVLMFFPSPPLVRW